MKIIGIDLGTTNTYLYGVEKGDAAPAPVTLPRISDENGCIATVVLYQDDKPCLIGNIAESEYHTNRARLASRTLRSQFKPEIAHGGSEAMRWMTDFLHELRAAKKVDAAVYRQPELAALRHRRAADTDELGVLGGDALKDGKGREGRELRRGVAVVGRDGDAFFKNALLHSCLRCAFSSVRGGSADAAPRGGGDAARSPQRRPS